MIRRITAGIAIAVLGALAFSAPASATQTQTGGDFGPSCQVAIEASGLAKSVQDEITKHGRPCHKVEYSDRCDEVRVTLANTAKEGSAKFRLNGDVHSVPAGGTKVVVFDAPVSIVVELLQFVHHNGQWGPRWIKVDDHVWTKPRRCPTPTSAAPSSAAPTSATPTVIVTPTPVITVSPSPVIVTIIDGGNDDSEGLPVTGTSLTMPLAVGGTLGVAGVILLGYALYRRRATI